MKSRAVGLIRVFLPVTCLFFAFPQISMPSVAVENEGMRFQVLLVIDVSDFSCPSCLQSIVDFIHVIPPSIREKRTVAVWRVSDPEEKDEADLKNRIWNKKMRGFVSANFIDFPIWMISESGSEAILGKGSRLLIFPPHNNTVLSYPFPLAFEERKDVQNLFAEWVQSGIH